MGHPDLAKRGQEKMRIKMMNEGSQKEKNYLPVAHPASPQTCTTSQITSSTFRQYQTNLFPENYIRF